MPHRYPHPGRLGAGDPASARALFATCALGPADRRLLLLLPCWWGAALAAATEPAISALDILLLFALFSAGAFAMRGAGCTYNDIVDRDFDARVSRTAIRPLPAGHASVAAAWTFALVQCAVGLAVLLALEPGAILVGLGSIPLVLAYPFMKRLSHWPQAWLGLTFNWGALVGWAAVHGEVAGPAYALYAAGIAWTLGYDTVYAHQDKEDDALAGVKSTALLFGAGTPLWVSASTRRRSSCWRLPAGWRGWAGRSSPASPSWRRNSPGRSAASISTTPTGASRSSSPTASPAC